MLIRRSSDIREFEVTDHGLYLGRRKLLALGAAALAAAVASKAAAAPLTGVIEGPFGTSEPLTSKIAATHYNNFTELGFHKDDPAENADRFPPLRPWTVEIGGECAKPGRIGIEDLIRPHALEERIYRMRCVETWSMVVPWIGVPLGDALRQFEPTSRAKFVEFTSVHAPNILPGQKTDLLPWPYVEALRIDEAMHPLTLLAVGLYGEDLPVQNGAPLRLVVPWKYGFKGAKSIVRIRFTETRPHTTWNDLQPDEYGFYANVNPAVDHVRWSQANERRIGEFRRRPTLPFNGYADQVAGLYAGQDLRRDF